MKKLLDRIKEAWYGALPFLLLFGIPLLICIVVVLIGIWDEIPDILNRIGDLGNGSVLYGMLLLLFGLIGLINAFWAFMLWFKNITEILSRKAKSNFWFVFPLIIAAFGFYALFEIIKQL